MISEILLFSFFGSFGALLRTSCTKLYAENSKQHWWSITPGDLKASLVTKKTKTKKLEAKSKTGGHRYPLSVRALVTVTVALMVKKQV